MSLRIGARGDIVDSDHVRPLIAYAYLAQSGAQDDILGGLIPIVSPIARMHAGKVYSSELLASDLQKMYGVDAHPWALEELIPRLVAAKILVEKKIGANRVIYTYAETINIELDQISEQDIQELVLDFLAFAREIANKAGFSIDESTLGSQFLEQIATSDFQYSLANDKARKQARAERVLQLRTDEDKEMDPARSDSQAAVERLRVMCASYVLHVSENKKEIFEQLVKLASGAIIAEYVLNIREPNSSVRLSGLKIYLDGPLVMSMLGLADEAAKKHLEFLMKGLIEKGATLCIFRDHVDEISDNLKAALSHSGEGTYRATYRRMRDSAFRVYAQSVLNDIDGVLRRNGLTIVKAPTTESYFSRHEYENLFADLGSYAVHARERDATAIAGVLRLRAGKITTQSYFHNCLHIFVTENARVARLALESVCRQKVYRDNHVPPVVTDKHLAGLMFVMYGGQKASELTHRRLLANCASALEPRHGLLQRVTQFLGDVDKDKAGHFVSMMTSTRASQHRAIYLLDSRRSINDLKDAEQAFGDFEQEIKASLGAAHEMEKERLAAEHLSQTLTAQQAHQAELARVKAESEKKFEEFATASFSQSQQIDALNIALKDVNSRADELQNLLEEQKRRDRAKVERELSRILSLASIKIVARKRLQLQAVSALVFVLTGMVSYFFIGWDDGVLNKLISVFVPLLITAVSGFLVKRLEKKSHARFVEQEFDKMVKAREDLFAVRFDYRIDFLKLKIDPLSESGTA